MTEEEQNAVQPLRRILQGLPDRPPAPTPPHPPAPEDAALMALEAARDRSMARHDAVVAVARAIERRGGSPTDWTLTDIDTVYAIAEQLIALDGRK